MANVSDNIITSSQIDWTYDPLTGDPFSGLSVQNYLRGRTEIVEASLTANEVRTLLNLE